ncbi:hypothetical protein DEO72_LG9g1623 [Vigna unguiculata]|uniref:Secreted protein n=1 Tax=Vigna unguiculata TaxID=3917 RepID=A0A4D6N287_VIGUN|nr:hypothetical protein DEO72_LG9g1623 [Vigna unguiculata]
MYFFSDFFLFCLTFPFLSSIFPSLRDRQLCKASTFHFFSTTNVFFLHPSGKKKASDTASCALPASVRVRCASDAGKHGSDAVSELHSHPTPTALSTTTSSTCRSLPTANNAVCFPTVTTCSTPIASMHGSLLTLTVHFVESLFTDTPYRSNHFLTLNRLRWVFLLFPHRFGARGSRWKWVGISIDWHPRNDMVTDPQDEENEIKFVFTRRKFIH